MGFERFELEGLEFEGLGFEDLGFEGLGFPGVGFKFFRVLRSGIRRFTMCGYSIFEFGLYALQSVL